MTIADLRLLPIVFPRAPKEKEELQRWSEKVIVALDSLNNTLTQFVTEYYVFTVIDLSGTVDNIIIDRTFPPVLTLNNGTFLTLIALGSNTGPVTLNGNPVKKIGAVGLVDLAAGDFFEDFPAILQWQTDSWVVLNIILTGVPVLQGSNFSITPASVYNLNVCTAVLTVTLNIISASFPDWFWVEIFAQNGNVTLQPNAADEINDGGVGVPLVVTTGNSGKLYKTPGQWWFS